MGRALDSILALKQNLTGGAFEALSPGSGDAFTIRAARPGSRIWLVQSWFVDSASVAQVRIRSPRLHDNVSGIRSAIPSGAALAPVRRPSAILPGDPLQPMWPVDVLIVEVLGTAADNVEGVLQLYYEDLQGVDARLVTMQEVRQRTVNLVEIAVAPTGGAAGAYGTTVALNSTDNRLIADTDYALLGVRSTLACTTVGIRGADTGNLRVSIPGLPDQIETERYFIDLDERSPYPCIPVIAANNQGATLVDVADVAGATAPTVTFLFAELS